MIIQTVTRKGTFDAAHRVMNHACQCKHIHGHLYQYELTFKFESLQDIGFNIDFKEIKRIGCQWIDDHLDHGIILNPKDEVLVDATTKLNSKGWLMSLNGEGQFCNPTAENIAKEIFLVMYKLFSGRAGGLTIERVRLYETPNCYTDCTLDSISKDEWHNFYKANKKLLEDYIKEKGLVEYDETKIKAS